MIYVPGSAVPAPTSVNPLIWFIGTLNSGQRFTTTFQVSVTASTTQTLINVATVVGGNVQLVGVSSQAATPFEPQAVTLIEFAASRQKDGVHVIWVTGSEIDTFGFAIYRSPSRIRSQAVGVTQELIPSKSVNTGGASYEFVDSTAEAGQDYYYWLQELETTSRLIDYGPIQMGGETEAVVLQPSSMVAVGSVPVGNMPMVGLANGVVEPMQQPARQVSVETQPQIVNAMSRTPVGTVVPAAPMAAAPMPVAPVSQAVEEAQANPPRSSAEVLPVATESLAALLAQAAPAATAGNVSAGNVSNVAEKRTAAVSAKPVANPTQARGISIQRILLWVIGISLMMALLICAGGGVWLIRRQMKHGKP